MKRAFSLTCCGLLLGGFGCANKSEAAYLQFNPSDFVTVGNISANSDIPRLSAANELIRNIAPSFSPTLSDPALDLAVLKVQGLSDFKASADGALAMISASGSSPADIAKQFASGYTDAADTAVSDARSLARQFGSALTGVDIEVPTTNIYFAAAVSQAARNEITQGFANLNILSNDLVASRDDISSLSNFMSQISARASAALDVNNALLDALSPFAGVPGVSTSLVKLIGNDAVFRDLASSADRAQSDLKAIIESVDNLAAKVKEIAGVYTQALSQPLAQSEWETSATITPSTASNFAIDFTPNSFSTNGADSPGAFPVGVLAITNNIAVGSNTVTEGTIDFNVKQTISYLGQRYHLSGSVLTPFQYVATINSDDEIASSDGFYIAALGLSFSIKETQTARALVGGAINSPFRLTSVTALDSNGFVSLDPRFYPSGVTPGVPSIPEPSTWLYMLIGFGLIAVASRYHRRHVEARYS